MTSINNSAMVQAGGPGQGAIPDLVKIGTIPSDTAIDVATEILEPVSFSQSECRFVLSNKGILHSNSRITFAGDGLTQDAPGVGKDVFLPANIGIASILQRVRLTVGGKTISEIEDFNHYYAYESMFVPPETNKEREQVFTGRVGLGTRPTLKHRQLSYSVAGNASATLAGNIESVSEADSICIDNGKDFDQNFNDLTVLPAATLPSNSRQVWDFQQEENKGVFSILLADLFPFLKMNQLPLFMMKEQVAIHLTFQDKQTTATSSQRICHTKNASLTLDNDFNIDRNDVKMVADYIFYPQDMMVQYATANRNMSFNYVDYQFVKRDVNASEFSSQLIQNVGGAGRIVNKVCVQVENKKPNTAGIINNYGSDSPLVSATGNGTITTNLRYNDLFLFPIDVNNSARHFHNILQTEGRIPHISRDIYSGQGQLAKERVFGGFEMYAIGAGYAGPSALNSDIRSRANWHCYLLNRNERVNSRGIEVYDRRLTMPSSSTLRCWLQVVRMAQLNDGMIEVVYA